MLKKLLVTAAATTALAAGSLIAAPAQAAAPSSAAPYPSSVVTVCKAKMKKATVKKGKHPKVKINVKSGVAQKPKGAVAIVVKQPGPNYNKAVKFKGSKKTVKLPARLSVGPKTVKVKFVPPAGSIFKKCKTTTPLTVKA